MGGWAKNTRLRWRCREFRFETLYTTPQIFLVSHMAKSENEIIILDGSKKSIDSSLVSFVPNNSHERVCWLPLLKSIHDLTFLLKDSCARSASCQIAAIRYQESSWDFQLPDVVRPLAKASVETTAIIARRLGMRWKEFDPVHGILRAEGNGQLITATNIRSLGTVIQYFETGPRFNIVHALSKAYIPIREADSLGFGRIRYSLNFTYNPDGRTLTIGTRQQVLATLRILEPSGHCAAILQTLYDKDPSYNLRMGDLVAMLMNMIHQRRTTLTRIPALSENTLGFTQSSQGRFALRKYLEKYCYNHEVGNQTNVILQACQRLRGQFIEWDRRKPVRDPDGRSYEEFMQYTDILHNEYDQAASWVSIHGLKENSLLSVHIRFDVFRENGETNLSASRSPNFDSEVKGYFEAWPDIVKALLTLPDPGETLPPEACEIFFFDAWVSMLFRACCWAECHEFVPGERVPSEWWGSQLPIYIG